VLCDIDLTRRHPQRLLSRRQRLARPR